MDVIWKVHNDRNIVHTEYGNCLFLPVLDYSDPPPPPPLPPDHLFQIKIRYYLNPC